MSYKLAREFPELKESLAVLRYSTQLPSDLSMFAAHEDGQRMEESQAGKTQDIMHKAGKRSLGLLGALLSVFSYALMYVLSTFLSMPLLLQDFAVDEAVAALFGYLCMWHLWLWSIHPSVAFLPLLGTLFLAHFASSALAETMRLQAHNELKYDDARHNKFQNERQKRQKQKEAEERAKQEAEDVRNDPYAPRNVRDLSSGKRRKRRRVKRRNVGSADTGFTGTTADDADDDAMKDGDGDGDGDGETTSRPSTEESTASVITAGTSISSAAASESTGSSSTLNSADRRERDRRKRRHRVSASMPAHLEGTVPAMGFFKLVSYSSSSTPKLV